MKIDVRTNFTDKFKLNVLRFSSFLDCLTFRRGMFLVSYLSSAELLK